MSIVHVHNTALRREKQSVGKKIYLKVIKNISSNLHRHFQKKLITLKLLFSSDIINQEALGRDNIVIK